MSASCRFSWALRTIGSETAPQRRSATIVAARWRSFSVGCFLVPTHGKMSSSSMRATICAIRESCAFNWSALTRDGTVARSMVYTRFLVAYASPTNRSRAMGGHRLMRSVGRIPGCSLSTTAVRLAKSSVMRRVCSTSLVVCARVSRYALGANFMNHLLNWSTDAAISCFQSCGLSALIGMPRTIKVDNRGGQCARRSRRRGPDDGARRCRSHSERTAALDSTPSRWFWGRVPSSRRLSLRVSESGAHGNGRHTQRFPQW